jgi:hypothetical protein
MRFNEGNCSSTTTFESNRARHPADSIDAAETRPLRHLAKVIISEWSSQVLQEKPMSFQRVPANVKNHSPPQALCLCLKVKTLNAAN